MSKALRGALVLPFLPLQKHAQKGGPRLPALWSEPLKMAGEDWGTLGEVVSSCHPKRSHLHDNNHCPSNHGWGRGMGPQEMTGSWGIGRR